MEFRFHDWFTIVKATGTDITRSARGRLAAETVVWSPQALLPSADARWTGIDDHRATVTIDAAGEDLDLTVTIDHDGRLTEVSILRWLDSADPPAPAPFGGRIDTDYRTRNGQLVAGSGVVGWKWDQPEPDRDISFEYLITHLQDLDNDNPP